MSVIAYDGKFVAADRMSIFNDHCREAGKLFLSKSGDAILGYTQYIENGIGLIEWFNNGADPDAWPSWQQSGDEWARLMVFPNYRPPYFFERLPYPQSVPDAFLAWGSGRDFALGALAMGADATKAVEIACKLCATCGMGIDTFRIDTGQCLTVSFREILR